MFNKGVTKAGLTLVTDRDDCAPFHGLLQRDGRPSTTRWRVFDFQISVAGEEGVWGAYLMLSSQIH